MKDIIERFESFGLVNSFLKQKVRILIGISGGADSIAMTVLFKNIQRKYSLFLMAAHVNYQLRGEESNLDELLVKNTCFSYGIPLYILKTKINNDKSIQNKAREIRLDYFTKLKNSYNLDYIALGHQYEDQTETILHRFIRGAGFTGLSGINPVNEDIIHPILPFKKETLINFLNTNKIEYRNDQTNFTNNYTRNQIRNELIPYLKDHFNPNIENKLIEYANLFHLSDKYFLQIAKKEFKRALMSKRMGIMTDFNIGSVYSELIFDLDNLKKVFPIVLYYIFKEAWILLTGSEKNFYAIHFQEMINILNSETGYKEFSLPENILILKDYNCFIFRNTERYVPEKKENTKEINLSLKSFIFNDYRFSLSKTKEIKESISETNNMFAVFDLDKIKPPIMMRYRKAGDSFIPFGMKGFKKVKDFFIDEKVPFLKRDSIILFTDTEKIFWISGFRIDQRVAISKETKNFLYVKMFKNEELKNRAAVRQV